MYQLVQVIFNLLLSIGEIVLVLFELHLDVLGDLIKLTGELLPWRLLEEVLAYSLLKLFQRIVVSFNWKNLVEAADHFLHLLVLELMC